jgi:hypothetical protein
MRKIVGLKGSGNPNMYGDEKVNKTSNRCKRRWEECAGYKKTDVPIKTNAALLNNGLIKISYVAETGSTYPRCCHLLTADDIVIEWGVLKDIMAPDKLVVFACCGIM